jgi:hypothetical protein
LALLLLAAPRGATAQDAGSLAFLGFSAGMGLAAVDSTARRAGADSLRCTRSGADSLIRECRASLPDADADRTVDLWLSAVGDSTSILTLAAVLTSARLDRWHEYLAAQYGDVPLRTRGGITSAQWIVGHRMMRLTWRAKGRFFEASVSLVDGDVLDAWGNAREMRGKR